MRATLLFIALLFSGTASFSQVDTTQSPFHIKHGKITYAFSSGSQKGTKVFIFDKWGEYSSTTILTEADTAFMRKNAVTKNPGKQNEQIINTPDCIYYLDLNARKGGKKLSPGSNAINTLTEAKYSSENKYMGREVYFGKTCEVYVLKDFIKFWFWNGICIKKEFLKNQENKTGEYCISIDEAYVPQRSDFKVPKDIKVR
jgi:hypothetical protein